VLWKTQPGRVSNPFHPTTNPDGAHEWCHIRISRSNGVAAVRRRAVWGSYCVVMNITVSGTAYCWCLRASAAVVVTVLVVVLVTLKAAAVCPVLDVL
jgi:hypothetical protein